MGARETALKVLIACRKEGGYANGALKEAIKNDALDRREAALAARLCYGVLQNRIRLDFYLQQLLTGRVKDLHPAVRDILHLGLYQLYMIDKIPASAAVNESVVLAKKYCAKQKASGFVNAVLRNAIRQKDIIRQPQTLEEKYSHPSKLLNLLESYVGKDRLEAMLRENNDIPATVVQVNTLLTDADTLTKTLQQEGVTVKAHPWMDNCLVLTATGSIERLRAFQEGMFYVQDAAAKLSVICAQLPENEALEVLDCCSAPGGKTFAAAIALSGKGSIYACDVYPHKTLLIEKGAQRLKLSNIRVFCQDASVPVAQWYAKMDAVIADVPCSGYGIIRKKPDIRYKDPDSMQQLPALQLEILKNQAQYVRPGGVLLYSTCTLVRKENEGVVEKFLKENTDFALEPLPLPAPFPKNESGMLSLVPGEYDTDGFFICRLRRKMI